MRQSINFKKFLESTLELSKKDHDFLHHIGEEELPACKVIELELISTRPTVVRFYADCKDIPRDEGHQPDLSAKLAERLLKHKLHSLGIITPQVYHRESDNLTVL